MTTGHFPAIRALFNHGHRTVSACKRLGSFLPFIKCLLSTYCVPGVSLGPRMNQTKSLEA